MLILETNKLDTLFVMIHAKYEVDLCNYARASLERRVERFLSIHLFESIEALTERLMNDSAFFDLFIKEITVNTTEMFRDSGCWKTIREQVLPSLAELPGIRIWHAGCSSGEEVFSMAILLKEVGLFDKTKLIATDLNKDIMKTAKKGSYSLKSMDQNEENYLQSGGANTLSDYCIRSDNSYIMNPELLQNVRFIKHDLSTGKEFSKFDLIICRNVMIYFNKDLQGKVFTLFRKSLFKKGFLIIGKKESLAFDSNSQAFSEISSNEKIYRLIH